MPKVYEPHPGVATQAVVLAAKISENPRQNLRKHKRKPGAKTDALTFGFGTD